MAVEIEWYTQEVILAGRTFQLGRVRNVDDMVDDISVDAFNVDERLPYWADLWPSAQALAEYVLENYGTFADRSVLELGCGLGLTALAISLTGPKRFVASDYEESALNATRRNFNRNRIAPVPELLLLDWRCVTLEQRFDIIAASDVAYEERFFDPLLDLFDALLKPDGTVILAEPNRTIARSFFSKLLSEGYRYIRTDKVVSQDGKLVSVAVYRVQKRS